MKLVSSLLTLALAATAAAALLPHDADGQEPPAFAVAVLHPTAGHDARGTVRFRQVRGGVQVDTRATGLAPGAHAYHVHLRGDCSAADGTSAGTHFNFHGSSTHPPADIDRITGDLGELRAGADGTARHRALIPGATLHGPKSIIGRAVIVHRDGNNRAQPPIGAAGPRLACGVIGVTGPPT